MPLEHFLNQYGIECARNKASWLHNLLHSHDLTNKDKRTALELCLNVRV